MKLWKTKIDKNSGEYKLEGLSANHVFASLTDLLEMYYDDSVNSYLVVNV
jgi:hypothetical protein